MTAKHIIADELDEPPRDADQFAEWALASLRAAAGAQDGDTITIAPDGTVGRLERIPRVGLLDGGMAQSLTVNDYPRDSEAVYRVVAP